MPKPVAIAALAGFLNLVAGLGGCATAPPTQAVTVRSGSSRQSCRRGSRS